MAGRPDDKGLFKRGRRWWLAIYVPADGKKKNLPLRPPGQTRATTNLHVARALAAEYRKAIRESQCPDLATSRVDDLITEFKAVNASEGSQRQARDNANRVKAFCGEFLAADQWGRFKETMPAAVHVRQIDLRRIQRWFIRLRSRGLTPKTLWNWRSALSAFCKFLIQRHYISSNPCLEIRLGKSDRLIPRFLTADECSAVLELARKHGIFAEVATALYTGCRREELRRMQWADVDFRRAIVVVPKSKSHRPRMIPMSGELRAVLTDHQAKTGSRKHVFPGRQRCDQSGMRRASWWNDCLKPIQKALPVFTAGMGETATGRGWHLFRHTFASRYAQEGRSLQKIGAWLGHADARTTQIYAHLQEGYDPDIEIGRGRMTPPPVPPSERG